MCCDYRIALPAGIIGLAWFGSTLPDQPRPEAAAVTPGPAAKLEGAAVNTPAATATPTQALLEYGFDDK
jgi:hypothetical protein